MPRAEERRKSYLAARAKGMAWIVAHQLPDGSFGPESKGLLDVETAAISLGLSGYADHAGGVLRYLKRTFYLGNGILRQSTEEPTQNEYCYAPALVAISAHTTGFYDLSMPIIAEILRFQDPQTGGIFGHPKAREAGAGLIMPHVTAMVGNAALCTGQLAVARRMGDYLLHLLAIQPDLENRFYSFFDTRQGLITEAPPELGKIYFGTFERHQPKQHYWLPGLLMAMLSDLCLATGEKKYLDGAITMFEFAAGCHADLYNNTLNHKLAWGCSRLYAATGDARHLEMALGVADFLVRVQDPPGTWLHSGLLASYEQQGYGLTIECASQLCIWLSRVLQVM